VGTPRHVRFPLGTPPRRLDQFLAEQLEDLSRSQVQRLIDEGEVLIAGEPARAGIRLKGGEEISVNIPPPAPVALIPEAIPLTILYEDSDLIVVDKPAGLVVHPAAGHSSGTLVNALLHHCRDLSGIGGEMRPGIVHRLDKETSGVLVAAKNDAAHRSLAEQFKVHSVERRYLALAYGLVQKRTGEIDAPIGRHPVDRKKMSGAARGGRRAVTRWEVLERFEQERLSFLELTLETGRTHQIRVHFSEMGFPLVGDPVYGRRNRVSALRDPRVRTQVQRLKRQFLHAHVLGFIHPSSGETLRFTSRLPEELQQILDLLTVSHEAGGSLGPAANQE